MRLWSKLVPAYVEAESTNGRNVRKFMTEAQEVSRNLLPAWKRYLQYRRQPHQAAYHRLREASRNSALPGQNNRLHSSVHSFPLVRNSCLRLPRRPQRSTGVRRRYRRRTSAPSCSLRWNQARAPNREASEARSQTAQSSASAQ